MVSIRPKTPFSPTTFTLLLLAAFCAAMPLAVLAQSKLYFSESLELSATLFRSNTSGTDRTALKTFTDPRPGRLAVEPTLQKICYTGTGGISCLPTAGGEPEIVVENGRVVRDPFVLDIVNQGIYFLSAGQSPGLYSMPRNAKTPELVQEFSFFVLGSITDMALDEGSKNLYYSVSSGEVNTTIERLELQSGTVTQVLEVEGSNPQIEAFVIDPVEKLLYFCVNDTTPSLRKVDLSSSVQDSSTVIPSLGGSCSDMAIDVKNRALYIIVNGVGIRSYPLSDFNSPTTVANTLHASTIALESLRPVTPEIKPAAPVVEVKEDKSVVINMEKFSGASLRGSKVVAGEELAEASKTKTKTTYKLEVRKTGSKNVIRRQSARNKYTLRGLASGSYATRYQVSIKKGRKVQNTPKSPARRFTIQ